MNSNKFIIGISIAFISILAVASGIYIYKLDNMVDEIAEREKALELSKLEELVEDECTQYDENDIVSEETVVSTSQEDDKVTPNTILVLERFYERCGYTVIQETVMPYDVVNMTKEQMEEKYADWTIREFNLKEVVMYKVIDDRCDEHYVLKEDDGYIDIYNENEDGTLEIAELTDISTEYLAEPDIEKLNEGIKVHGKVELEKILEDYNS